MSATTIERNPNPLWSHRYDPGRANRVADLLAGESLAKVARRVGLTRFQICRIFNGSRSPSLPTVYAFSGAYNSSIEAALDYLAMRVQEARESRRLECTTVQ